jgi:ring-1,2-phenylacetyl-CoA epoxidase subunit PaaD
MVNLTATTEQVWAWLREVEDPEIPVISIVDLGIVRDVQWEDGDMGTECVVTLTPTYSGCPATHVIAQEVEQALHSHGVSRVRLRTRISPAWTTDWLTAEGQQKLREYGIAPPGGSAAQQHIRIDDIGGRATTSIQPACPRCESRQVVLVSHFGSTPCKALYRCRDCLEPFDHFKRH